MYVRFKVSSSSSTGYGMQGMIETIRAVATASAGATISDPAGTTQFQVVSNTEAGGWTVDSSTTASTYSYSNWNGSIQINSPTNKSGYSKSFRVFANSSSTAQTNWGSMLCQFKAYDGSSARYTASLVYNASNSTSTSHNMWMPTGGIYNTSMTWHFSCTADYAYLWYELDTSIASGYANNFAGVSELQNVPSSYLGTGNAFFPAVGFYSCSYNASYPFGTSTTSYYHDYFAHSIHGSYPNGDDGPSDYYNATNVQYTGTGELSTNDCPGRFGPFYYTGYSNSYGAYNFKPIYNANGEKVGSLIPAFYFNPYKGIPFTTLSGFYYYEPFERFDGSYSSLPYATRQSEIIYDASGDKYTLQYQYGQFGIRAFRSE